MCGRAISEAQDTRYIVKIEVSSAYDPLELSDDDFADHSQDIHELLDEMADMDADDLQDQVYKSFRYDLCPACHEAYLKDPLGRAAKLRSRFGAN
jgi:hypothetical protein